MDTVSTSSIEARQLRAEELKLANSVLFNAYRDDPFFRAVLPEADYDQKLRAALREELQELWQRQQPLVGVFSGNSLVAVACLLDDQYPIGQTRFWNWRLKMSLGTGWKPAKQWMAREEAVIERYSLQNNWLLQFIAVAPAYQRQGYGDQLLQALVHLGQRQGVNGIATLVYRPELLYWFQRRRFERLFDVEEAEVTGSVCAISWGE